MTPWEKVSPKVKALIPLALSMLIATLVVPPTVPIEAALGTIETLRGTGVGVCAATGGASAIQHNNPPAAQRSIGAIQRPAFRRRFAPPPHSDMPASSRPFPQKSAAAITARPGCPEKAMRGQPGVSCVLPPCA